MPVIFQREINSVDIENNPNVFYAVERAEKFIKKDNNDNIVPVYTKKSNTVNWTDVEIEINRQAVDECLINIHSLLVRGAIIVVEMLGYTEELVKYAPKTAEYLDFRLEELYQKFPVKEYKT